MIAFRLRFWVLSLVFFCCACISYAQITVYKPFHVRHVLGYVVNKSGKPIADAQVTLDNGDSVVYKTKTDDSGRFEFNHAGGRLWLHVNAPHYSAARRQVVVGPDFRAFFHSGTFYVMLGPGACSDECSWVFTRKIQFNRAVLLNTAHN
jgi:hypothetical protein